jgi:hypothetical protein
VAPQDLIVRYQAVYGQLRTGTAARVGEAWARLGGPSDTNIEAFLAVVLPLVQGAEVATVRLVAGYMAAMARDITGTGTEAAIAIGAVTGEALRGVAPADVYTRPIITMRAALAAGKEYPDAFRIAQQRASTTAETDVLLAQRAATDEVIRQEPRIVGYRRVLTGRSCAFCATASTQRYHSDNLMPIHDRCDCGIAPIFGTRDPGNVINRGLLGDLKAAARDGGGNRDYWDQRHVTVEEDGTVNLPKVAVHEHGELGPVLTDAADHFTGPADVAA